MSSPHVAPCTAAQSAGGRRGRVPADAEGFRADFVVWLADARRFAAEWQSLNAR
jgi:hypothetical protein